MVRMKYFLGIAFALALASLGILSVSVPVSAQAPVLGVTKVIDASVLSTGAGCTATSVAGCGARVGNDKTLATNTEGRRATYRAVISGLVPVASATDVVYIPGSATKTVRVTRVLVTGTAGTAVSVPVILVKRSAANTGGTCAAMTAVPIDSANAVATAAPASCTANPTLGTAVGTVASLSTFLSLSSASGANTSPIIFGTDGGQPLILRGVAQTLGVNFGGVSVSSGVVSVTLEWTEE